jgi:predicted GIY-YIG superfamily endonuclease
LDVLCIDEMGYLSAEMLNVMDTVLRCVRCKSSFMGGVLILTTLDHQQLQPIRAKPALLSTLVVTSFQMVKMEESVRARTDLNLQRVIAISRFDTITVDNITEFKNIIIHKCQHVRSWQDSSITADMIRVVGTRKGVTLTEEEYYKEVAKKNLDVVFRSAETVQAVLSSHGNWKSAEDQIKEMLNKKVNEVENLRLHKNIMVEFTYNKPNHWSSSQIGIILDLPSQQVLNMWKPIVVMIAPVGIKKLPAGEISKVMLEQHDWKEIHVGTAPEMEHRMTRGITAKRKQYAIRPRIAMTIHRAMGGDFGQIVTRVGAVSDGYQLWLKEQVIVLISRTHMASDLIFVGDSPEQTANVLAELLFKVSPYSSYMHHIVDQMTNTDLQHVPVLRPLRHLPYNVRHAIIPTNANGFVYALMSLKDHSTTYIGQTKNLANRLNQHNGGIGAHATANPYLRPWHCIAFVTGFVEDNQQERIIFEHAWQHQRNTSGKYALNPCDVIRIGKELVGNKNKRYGTNHLRFVQCIDFCHT